MVKNLIWVILFAIGFIVMVFLPVKSPPVAQSKESPSTLTLSLPFRVPSAWSDFNTRSGEFIVNDLDTWFVYGWFGAIKSTQQTGGTQYSAFDNRHTGIDFAGREGLTVAAAAPGQVYFIGDLYGKTVMIRHQDGYRTVYGHLEEVLVKPDQIVERGEIIGTLGKSGTVNPHLHFEVKRRVKDQTWAINPRRLLTVNWNTVVTPDLLANHFYEGDPDDPDDQADFLWPKFPL